MRFFYYRKCWQTKFTNHVFTFSSCHLNLRSDTIRKTPHSLRWRIFIQSQQDYMVPFFPSQADSKKHLWVLLAILILSSGLNFYNLDFPLQLHGDEPKKVRFVLENVEDFRHPILMLQVARAVNGVFGIDDPDRLIILCRAVSAFFGVVIVLLTYILARKILARGYALFAAFAVAVSPIMVVHAHYFKEDMIFTACSLLSLICFIKFLEHRNFAWNTGWGLATGLAFSAQYKAVILGLLYLAIPFVVGKMDKRWFYKSAAIGFGFAGLVFFAVNSSIFLHPEKFFEGVNHEAGHLIRGHRLKIYALSHGFSFHLFNSIVPGISWGLTITALLGLIYTATKWKSISDIEKIFFLYAMFFYFFQEAVHLKPFPDFMRYMIPLVPFLMIFSSRAIPLIESWLKAFCRISSARKCNMPIMAILILWPFYDSCLLDYHLTRDTRSKVEEWVESSGKKVLFGRYTNTFKMNGDFRTVLDVDIAEVKKSGVEYLCVSSFVYDRYFMGAKLSDQNPRVYQLHEKYVRLFSQPTIEIRPQHRSFAFSNPVVRIVDIRGWP